MRWRSVSPSTYSLAMYLQVVGRADVEDGHDVRVIDHRGAADLALEVREVAVARVARAQDLQRNLPPHESILGEINLGRASSTQMLQHAIAAHAQYVHDLESCRRSGVDMSRLRRARA
jgi:hypothetical protein